MFGAYGCGRVRRLLWDYAAGDLCGRDSRRVADHLHGCPRCTREAAAHRSAERALAEARACPEPASLRGWDDLVAELARQPSPARRPARALPAWAGATVCAAALLAVGLGAWVTTTQPATLPPLVRPPAQAGRRATTAPAAGRLEPGGPPAWPAAVRTRSAAPAAAARPPSPSGRGLRVASGPPPQPRVPRPHSERSGSGHVARRPAAAAAPVAPSPVELASAHDRRPDGERWTPARHARDYVMGEAPASTGAGAAPAYVMEGIPASGAGISLASYAGQPMEVKAW